jgi:hypothetical protein
MAHDREVMVQLVTVMSCVGPYSAYSRRFFRQMQSSPEVMWQLAIRTLREWSMSMPSPLRILRLLSRLMPSITTPSQPTRCTVQ